MSHCMIVRLHIVYGCCSENWMVAVKVDVGFVCMLVCIKLEKDEKRTKMKTNWRTREEM